jgi:hypothetical protein
MTLKRLSILLVYGLTLQLLTAAAWGQNVAPARVVPPGLDGQFVGIAQQLPGFGGYYLDGLGDLNVYLTDLSREPDARALLADVARNRPTRWQQPWALTAEIIVHAGDFDFLQLDDFRTRLGRDIATIPGIQFDDSDESINRVVIGVTSEEARQRVLARLSPLGVPENAVVVKVVPAGSLATTVDDPFLPALPLRGGIKIGYIGADGGQKSCTLGANVWYSNPTNGIPVGTPGFYTASHCSKVQGFTEGMDTLYSQGGTQIGHEMFDPPLVSELQDNRFCPYPTSSCRNSDVTFVGYDSVLWDPGAVARTTYGQVGNQGLNNTAGSLILSSPAEFIYQGGITPITGMALDKVGETTGWTTGNVGSTCVNWVTGHVYILCSNWVNAAATFGDSGAPVFQVTGSNTASFSGIVWGQYNGGYWFSATDQIAKDMGPGVNYLSH